MRAFSGAYLFGIPLLYTMEMWWLGETARPGDLVLVLAVMLLANFWLVAAVGPRRTSALPRKVAETLVTVAVGTVAALVVLLILNELSLEQSARTILAKTLLQALPLSIGAALAGIIFRPGQDREGDEADGDAEAATGADGSPTGVWRALFRDLGATAIGAVFIAATIAPTEEIPMIAARMTYPNLLGLIALSLIVGYIIVFASGFDPASRGSREHLFQHPLTETSLSYLVSLLVAFGALLLTQQLSTDAPPAFVLAQTLALGLPAMIGGAAGRIAI